MENDMNVILVMSDSFRRDHIGALGDKGIKTPALDRFVSQATDFPNFRVGSFPTIPQRTDMITGLYSYPTRPWQALEPEDVVLAELLSTKGMATYASADTPHIFHSGGMTFMRGFDGFHWSRGSEGDTWWTDYYGEADYKSPTGKGRVRGNEAMYKTIWSQAQRRVREMDWVTPQTFQAAIEWLTCNYRRRSFFLYIDAFDPHEPWDPPRWARDLYLPDAKGRPYAWAEYGSAKQYGPAELRHMQALYAGECTMVDRWFGRLMDTVELLGLAENTMVIFLADHGHYLGYSNDGGQVGKTCGFTRGGKLAGADADVFMPLLDTVINPPFLIRMPGQTDRKVCDELAQPVDVMPTVLEFCKARVPKGLHGKSLLPLLAGKKLALRETAITAWHKTVAQISDRRWLYGLWEHHHAPKLFDRKTDPDQKRNVIKKHSAVARRLHKELMAEMRSLGAGEDWLAKLES
jgi:arylsulfatase A-like enzyme